jgi:glycosyltransferase involved in cell wall biosynthesis
MKTATPRVSVGLPVFNGAHYLSNSLKSLLEQEYEDFELIISDNASTDETPDICREFARRDKRIRYSRNEINIGLPQNHNRAFALSRGEFFKWAAHDDEYPRQMLRRHVEVFDAATPDVSVVYAVCEFINELGNSNGMNTDNVEKCDPRPARRLGHLLCHLASYNCTYGLIRSEMLRKTRLHGPFPMADQVLISELAMLGMFIQIDEPLLRLRIHDGRSFAQHKNPQALRELFDPSCKGRRQLLSIRGRVQLELLRSAWRIPTRLSDKVACVCVALAVPSWKKCRNFAGLQKSKLTRVIAGARSSRRETGQTNI